MSDGWLSRAVFTVIVLISWYFERFHVETLLGHGEWGHAPMTITPLLVLPGHVCCVKMIDNLANCRYIGHNVRLEAISKFPLVY